MDGEKRETLIPRASETFPVQFNMLHHLVLICCFLHENVGFLHQVVNGQLNPVQVERAPRTQASDGVGGVFFGTPSCHRDNNHDGAFVEGYYPVLCLYLWVANLAHC